MYTTKEAAKALNVQPRTIRRYAKLPENPLKVQLKNLRGDILIPESELVAFAQLHNLALDLPRQP